jgi:hypothetical protein
MGSREDLTMAKLIIHLDHPKYSELIKVGD